jgi:hypothetical protein
MKRLLVCLGLTALATVSSLQAGEQCTKEKAAAQGAQTATCSSQTQSCCSSAQTTSASKCTPQKVAKTKTDTVKGAVLLVQR